MQSNDGETTGIEDEGPTVVLSGDSSSELSDEDDNLKGEFGDTELDDAEFDIESEDTESDKERMEPEAQSTKGVCITVCAYVPQCSMLIVFSIEISSLLSKLRWRYLQGQVSRKSQCTD